MTASLWPSPLRSFWWLLFALGNAATLYAICAALTMPRLGCAAHVRRAARRAQ
ncbi:hypothetical protein C7405_1413 [Paraburkholderia caballeronis]|uniref:hypothetical protein n=1 Tax=Paraburkholderia caballeronis TaxID=416943 RepID=UPI0010D0BAB0|nr:hypothetical protein [Paraburkholderia caballeronis]TDV22711.1 hypothetical protein C7405_1413 [Paraburkholderia caballeronis]